MGQNPGTKHPIQVLEGTSSTCQYQVLEYQKYQRRVLEGLVSESCSSSVGRNKYPSTVLITSPTHMCTTGEQVLKYYVEQLLYWPNRKKG
jgi:hypothetical protein